MRKNRNRIVANLLCLMAALLVSFSELVHPLRHGHHEMCHEHAVPHSVSDSGNGYLLDRQSDEFESPEADDFCPICAGLLSCEPVEDAQNVPALPAAFTVVHDGSIHQSIFVPFIFSRGPPESYLF